MWNGHRRLPATIAAKSPLNIRKLGCFRIAPQLFDVVKLPRLRIKNMHDGIKIVHQYPTGVCAAFRVRGHRKHLILYFFIYAVGNSLDVRIGVSLADNEKVGGSIIQTAQIQLDNIFTFFVADTVNNQVVELFGARVAGLSPL